MLRRARAVVIHPDPVIRAGWARAVEASGMQVTRCVGPLVSCALDRGCARCPLLDGAALAIYAESLLTQDFVTRLRASGPPMVIAARDRHRADDDHEPVYSRVIATAI